MQRENVKKERTILLRKEKNRSDINGSSTSKLRFVCEAAIPGKNTQNKTIVSSFIVIIILLSPISSLVVLFVFFNLFSVIRVVQQ